MSQEVFAFAQVTTEPERISVYEEIRNGKSRFGMWEQEDSLKDAWYGPNSLLLRIKKDDWIVHVNMPSRGRCVAVQVVGEYDFDEGISCSWGQDFNNYIPINPNSIIEFDRNDPNIIKSVNLAPRRRIQRVLEVEDFLKSLENIKNSVQNVGVDEKPTHLKDKISGILPSITNHIHKLNKGKAFEIFLLEVFEKIPYAHPIPNGFGFRTDNGADLIVDFEIPIFKDFSLTNRLVVQAKSYEGEHIEINAIDQLVNAIEFYKADAGLLITTGEKTPALENRAIEESDRIQKNIFIISGADVAKFTLKFASDLLI